MSNFIDKTILELSRILEDTLTFQKLECPYFCKKISERARFFSVMVSIIFLTLFKSLYVLLFFNILILILLLLIRMDLRNFYKRVLSFGLLFSFIIILPYIFFNPITFSFGFYKEGLVVALRFFLRVLVSISLIQFLLYTNSWVEIIKGLRSLFVPSLIIYIITITYRYIFLLITLALEMFLAKKSRTINYKLKREYAWIGSSMSLLFLKSQELMKEVSQGMISRGISKKFKVPMNNRLKKEDYIFVSILILFLGVLLWMDQFLN
jgi:cobalt/nickel transport system permease protein